MRARHSSKAIERILKACEAQGAKVERGAGGGHFRVKPLDGGLVIISCTHTSAERRIKGDLKRAGIKV